jgi:hypothetical protein
MLFDFYHKYLLIRFSVDVTEFDSRTHASGVSHDVSDVILFVNTLEEMSLWPKSKNSDVIATVRLGCKRNQRRLQERISS